MDTTRAHRPLRILGTALLVLAALVIAISVTTFGDSGFGLTCTTAGGCTTDTPVLFTLLNFAYRCTNALLVAGIVFVAGADAALALGRAPERQRPTEGDDPMTFEQQDRRPLVRPQRAAARRLWIAAGVMLVASMALGVWSSSPAGQNLMMVSCSTSDCPPSPAYVLNQLSYTLVPAGMLGGLLVLGMALVVSRLRPAGAVADPTDLTDDIDDIDDIDIFGALDAFDRPDASVRARAEEALHPNAMHATDSRRHRRLTHASEQTWDGKDLEPFRRPDQEPSNGTTRPRNA